jgi:glycerol-3-phosphate dehydrogenase
MSFDKNTGLDESRKLSIVKLISRVKFKGLFPDVRDNSITGGAVWSDAQAYNSERLVLSFIMSAMQRGAHIYNYMCYEKPIIEDHRISGVILRDRFSGKSYDIKTDSVIDCTGPWNNNSDYYKKLIVKNELVLAVNIVLKNRILDYALGIKIPYETAGGITERLLFFTPWRNTTIIGTWYSICNQPPDRLSFDKEELKECLKQINSIFKRELISFDDIAYVHKGLLPVESQDRIKPEANLKNRPEIIHAQEQGGVGGHFLVQGVKYTTARNVAEFTINKILKYLKKPVMRSVTDELYLYGANYDSFGDWKRLQIEKYTGIHSNEIIDRLICNYGSNIESILGIAKSKSVLSELVPGTKLVLKAEIEYVLENEMTYTLSDLLLRRTDIGTLGLPTVETIKYCIDMLFKKHNWVDGDIKKNIKDFLTFYPEWIVSDYKTRFQI